MKYAVVTFGCRVNQADSLGFEEELRAAGAMASGADDADVVIVNTCSVTASADQGARQTIRRLGRTNPSARIVVTGCYATRRPDEIRELPNVLRVVANDDKPRLLQLLRADLQLTTADRFGDGEGSCGAAIEPGVAGRTAFTLRVQTGCAEACSYCIIPTTRGLPRSVPIDQLLVEIERIAAAGFKEIALTGVHLGSYGRDLTPPSSLIELLRALQNWHGLKTVPYISDSRAPDSCRGRSLVRPEAHLQFRISSLEPMDCTPEIVDLVAGSDRFAPHFHLPLQHASEQMLTAMRRPYSSSYYCSLVEDIRARVPAASIGCDIIVGFPGETDQDFATLTRYLETSPLTHLHVFPYSDRPGTEASAFNGKVHGALVRLRAAEVRDIGRRLTARFHQSQLGTTRPGLTLEDGSLVVTDNYLKVRVPPGRERNERVRVRITDAAETLRGEIC
jgi:threonylcarbamoyladenosine tRNA methylthiotransferase MtaB